MIRKLDTIQKQENLNTVFAIDEKGNGNANHAYVVVMDNDCEETECGVFNSSGDVIIDEEGFVDLEDYLSENVELITFQSGARSLKDSTHGVLDTDLLEIVRDRLIGFQSGTFASKYNEEALYHVEKALEFMNERAMERVSRGVLGTHNK